MSARHIPPVLDDVRLNFLRKRRNNSNREFRQFRTISKSCNQKVGQNLQWKVKDEIETDEVKWEQRMWDDVVSPCCLILRCKHVKKPDNWEPGRYSGGCRLNRIHHQNRGFTSHSKCRKSRVWYGRSSSHAKITPNIKIESSMDFFETRVSCRSFPFETGVSGRSIFLKTEFRADQLFWKRSFTPIDLYERKWQFMSGWVDQSFHCLIAWSELSQMMLWDFNNVKRFGVNHSYFEWSLSLNSKTGIFGDEQGPMIVTKLQRGKYNCSCGDRVIDRVVRRE
jgi:hypothetical protein